MYKNVGRTIQVVAIVQFILLALAAFIYGIKLLDNGSTEALGIICILAGPLVSWLLSLVLYGFGRLVQCTECLAKGQLLPPDPTTPEA